MKERSPPSLSARLPIYYCYFMLTLVEQNGKDSLNLSKLCRLLMLAASLSEGLGSGVRGVNVAAAAFC